MRIGSFLTAVLAGVILQAADVPVEGFFNLRNWRANRKGAAAAWKPVKENGKVTAIKLSHPGIATCEISRYNYPVDGGNDLNKCYSGIAFEVKGDGSNEWGAVIVQEISMVSGRYYFPLKNTDWHEVRVSFADMAPASDHALGLPAKFPVGRIGLILFNDRWALNWCNAKRPKFSYEVRNFRLVEDMKPAICTKNVKTRPLADVIKDMKAGKKVLVTCFGDSITAGTALMRTDKRYAILLGEMLRKEFKNDNITTECVAIGGAHTYDSIGWLDRDLSKGNPDVATMLIGYNNRTGAQSAELYRAQLEMWIERLLAKTGNKTAIILIPSIPGVPRWETQDDMAEVTYQVAKKYNCTICPIEKVIKNIGIMEYRNKYLRDAIHPNQAGHMIFAQELLKLFVK